MLQIRARVCAGLIAVPVVMALGGVSVAHAATLEAAYTFDGDLTSAVAGAPDLTAVDPEGVATFSTDTVYGSSRTVYNYGGANTPAADQGGLTVSTAGLITSNDYSVEMVFKFNERDGAWRRLIDVQDRSNDDGFYVDPSNHLDIYPVGGSGTTLTSGNYYDVTVTNDGTTVNAYLGGQLEVSLSTALMDVDSNNIMNFFLDNLTGSGIGEWSSGSVALIKIYDGALTADEVAANALEPFQDVPPPSVPEPASLSLLGIAGLGLLARRR